MKKRWIAVRIVLFGIALLLIALAVRGIARRRNEATSGQDANRSANAIKKYNSLSAEEKEPQRFEPYLKEHPEDETRRMAAMGWYFHLWGPQREKSSELLKYHTFQMIKYHPGNMDIWFDNVPIFDADAQYCREVIQRLEEQVGRGHREPGVYANLAGICEQGALPPTCRLRTEINEQLANKAVRYYRAAIRAAGKTRSYQDIYGMQLAKLLSRLGKHGEALTVCKQIRPFVGKKRMSDFLYTYGMCLMKSSKMEEAKQSLKRVRQFDTEGWQHGPGHATADAETVLGLMALKAGDTDAACKYLLSSCKVQRCPHNTTFGMPLGLARKLLDKGHSREVVLYCQTVVKDFTRLDPETIHLLNEALEDQRRAANIDRR